MTLARTLHRPFEVVAYAGNKRLSRVVWSRSEWDALDQMQRQMCADPISATPLPIDFGPTLPPESVVLEAIYAQNRSTARRLDAAREIKEYETIDFLAAPGKTLRPLALFLAVSAGIALVALVHLMPYLIKGVEALWRMVGM